LPSEVKPGRNFDLPVKNLAKEQKKEVLRPLVYRNTSSPISREATNGLDLEN
jgi:hypothetical protein